MISSQNKIAIFDMDGTLIDTQSQRLFLRYMRNRGIIDYISYLIILLWFILYKFGLVNSPRKIMNFAFSFLRGIKEEEMTAFVNEFVKSELLSHVYPEAKNLVKKHKESGDGLFLVSNALEYIVIELGKHLEIDPRHCIGTKLETKNGLLTGLIGGDMVYSDNKVMAIKKALGQVAGETWGYSDHITDLGMLIFVDHPNTVNPDPKLRAVAQKRKWPILQFK